MNLARTMAFCSLSLTQPFHAFDVRSLRASLLTIGPFHNRWLIGAFFLCAAIQVVLVPGLGSLFKLAGLTAAQWGIVWLLAFSIIALNEAGKLVVRAFTRARDSSASATGVAG